MDNVQERNNCSVALVRKRIIPTERPPSVGEVTTLARKGCHVVSAMDPQSR
jgi:hypothetical protein